MPAQLSFVLPDDTDFIIFGGKHCTRCHDYLPANSDYFARDRRHEDGLTFACRQCRNARERRRYNAKLGRAVG